MEIIANCQQESENRKSLLKVRAKTQQQQQQLNSSRAHGLRVKFTATDTVGRMSNLNYFIYFTLTVTWIQRQTRLWILHKVQLVTLPLIYTLPLLCNWFDRRERKFTHSWLWLMLLSKKCSLSLSLSLSLSFCHFNWITGKQVTEIPYLLETLNESRMQVMQE